MVFIVNKFNLNINPKRITYDEYIEVHKNIINPLASPCAGASALKYGDVNTVTPSPGEVKGLIEQQMMVIVYFIV